MILNEHIYIGKNIRGKIMPKKHRDYEIDLLERLKDPEYAAGYLNAVLEDSDQELQERFLLALRDVAKAHGMSQFAVQTSLAREAMYRALSEEGNPQLDTLLAILHTSGLTLSINVRRKIGRKKSLR